MPTPPSLRQIADEWADCTRCGLCRNRKNVVLGHGNPKADIMLIGEAPGAEEDEYGWPFIGPSGDVLTLLLNNAGLTARKLSDWECGRLDEGTLDARTMLDVRQNLFTTNLVCCRPEDNRDPSDLEAAACWPRLAAQIYAVDPLLIVAVGKKASEFLVGRNVSVLDDHGRIFDVKMPGLHREWTVPVMVTLHPSYLLRNRDMRDGGPWANVHGDLEMAKGVVDLMNHAYGGGDIV